MRQRAYQRNGKMKKNFHFGTTGKKAWLLALSLLCFCTTAVAQTTYTSVQTGAWNNPSTWSPAGVPGTVEGDVAIISTGHTVTLNVSPLNTLASVTVNGTLRYDAGPPRTLRARNVTVNSGGTIDLIDPGLPPPFILSHQLQLEPLSTDPAEEATTFQNNGTVNFVSPSAQCNTIFLRSTKGPQWLRGTGTFNLSAVVMVNTSTLAPTTDFAPPAETDCNSNYWGTRWQSNHNARPFD
jgi:hypothetical protein